MRYEVQLEAFQGPLDLLLHLIHKLEVDIFDIPVAEITEQYLAYINAMKVLELDVASEYLVMAATLLELKSKMILPREKVQLSDDYPVNEGEENDPRAELVRQLLEYKRYKEATVHMRELEEERQLLFSKVPEEWKPDGDVVTKQLSFNFSIYDLLFSYQKMVHRRRLEQPIMRTVEREERTIEDEIARVDALLLRGARTLYDLIEDPYDREQIVMTFLAILHMLKECTINVEQEQTFGEIVITVNNRKDESHE
ncbi:MAG: segregation/condensation protein A [Bacilli bacterium]